MHFVRSSFSANTSNWCPENGRHLVLRCKVAVETVLQLFNPFMGCTISASLHLIASKVDSLFHLVSLLPCRQLDAVSILLRMEQLGFFMIECFLDALQICFWVPAWCTMNLLISIKASCSPVKSQGLLCRLLTYNHLSVHTVHSLSMKVSDVI